MASADDLSLSWPLVFAIVLLCITLATAFARGYARRIRRRTRQQTGDFVRACSAMLAARMGPVELREMADDADPGAYWSAIEALAVRLERPDWITLSRALQRNRHAAAERQALRDDSPWRAELAARRLGLLRSKPSRRSLRRALVTAPEIVRHSAARALGRYEDIAALRWLVAHPERLHRRSPKEWTAILRGFGPRAFPVLAAALDPPPVFRPLEIALVDALGHSGDTSRAAAIERRLEHEDAEVRIAAARALGRLRAAQCTTSLIGALKDEAWHVRAQAARALGRMNAPMAVYALTTRLTDRSWWVRRHAAYALAELGDDGIAALVHTAEHSDDRFARDMANEVLSGGVRLAGERGAFRSDRGAA